MTAGSNKDMFGRSERQVLRYANPIIYLQELRTLGFLAVAVSVHIFIDGIQIRWGWGGYGRRGESLFVPAPGPGAPGHSRADKGYLSSFT